MAGQGPSSRPGTLRERLCEGDPLADGMPAPHDLARMRRRLLSTVAARQGEDQVPGRWWLPAPTRRLVLAGSVASLAIAAGAAAWLLRPGPHAGHGSTSARSAAARPAPLPPADQGPAEPETLHTAALPRGGISGGPITAAPTAPRAVSASAATGAQAPAPGTARPRPQLNTPGPTPAAGTPASTDATADRPRQLQFVTPGGTRIIWTLDPDFALSPGPSREEDLRWSAE
jgi:hypothetical protein